jgi:peptidoglycan/xylan/chitin deacetylase (PgdA/CDA1 family)
MRGDGLLCLLWVAQSSALYQCGPGAANSSVLPKRLFLSFDDGPTVGTGHILDVLRPMGIRASFYLTAANFDGYLQGQTSLKEDVKVLHKIVKDGHMLGGHSFAYSFSRQHARRRFQL